MANDETFQKNDGKHITGLATGYNQLDSMTCGLQKGDLVILAARPSMGKTSFLLNVIEHMGVVDQLPVALFSLAISKDHLAQRLLASHAQFSLQQMQRGIITPEDWTRLQLASGNLEKTMIFLDDSPDLTISQIRARAHRIKSEHGIQCVFVDYLQLVRFHGHSESRQAEVAEISRGLKALARELEIPVVTASQLNSKPADRSTHRPQMSDLRESGSIEQDADVVALLHREDYYHQGEEGYMPTGLAELIVAKQRNGLTGIVPLVFREECTRFESAASGSSI